MGVWLAPVCPSQSSVTITGQRQQHLRAITEIARDDLECPPQHRENHFLTKRPALVSAGPLEAYRADYRAPVLPESPPGVMDIESGNQRSRKKTVWNVLLTLRGTHNKAWTKVEKMSTSKGRKKNYVMCSPRQT